MKIKTKINNSNNNIKAKKQIKTGTAKNIYKFTSMWNNYILERLLTKPSSL